jgi:kynurenine formamidase
MASEDLQRLLGGMKVVELSHVMEEGIPLWPTHAKFMHNIWESLELGDDSTNYQIIMHEHNGTHVDMPSHYVKGGESAESMAAACFMGPCVSLNFSNIGEGGLVTQSDILQWEKENGQISSGDIVLINLGWSQYWHVRPDEKKFCTNWPGVSGEAAEYLAQKKIKMISVDTMSVDAMKSKGDPAHRALLPNKILITENLTNLELLPVRAFFMELPLLIRQELGCPVRAIGLY